MQKYKISTPLSPEQLFKYLSELRNQGINEQQIKISEIQFQVNSPQDLKKYEFAFLSIKNQMSFEEEEENIENEEILDLDDDDKQNMFDNEKYDLNNLNLSICEEFKSESEDQIARIAVIQDIQKIILHAFYKNIQDISEQFKVSIQYISCEILISGKDFIQIEDAKKQIETLIGIIIYFHKDIQNRNTIKAIKSSKIIQSLENEHNIKLLWEYKKPNRLTFFSIKNEKQTIEKLVNKFANDNFKKLYVVSLNERLKIDNKGDIKKFKFYCYLGDILMMYSKNHVINRIKQQFQNVNYEECQHTEFRDFYRNGIILKEINSKSSIQYLEHWIQQFKDIIKKCKVFYIVSALFNFKKPYNYNVFEKCFNTQRKNYEVKFYETNLTAEKVFAFAIQENEIEVMLQNYIHFLEAIQFKTIHKDMYIVLDKKQCKISEDIPLNVQKTDLNRRFFKVQLTITDDYNSLFKVLVELVDKKNQQNYINQFQLQQQLKSNQQSENLKSLDFKIIDKQTFKNEKQNLEPSIKESESEFEYIQLGQVENQNNCSTTTLNNQSINNNTNNQKKRQNMKELMQSTNKVQNNNSFYQQNSENSLQLINSYTDIKNQKNKINQKKQDENEDEEEVKESFDVNKQEEDKQNNQINLIDQKNNNISIIPENLQIIKEEVQQQSVQIDQLKYCDHIIKSTVSCPKEEETKFKQYLQSINKGIIIKSMQKLVLNEKYVSNFYYHVNQEPFQENEPQEYIFTNVNSKEIKDKNVLFESKFFKNPQDAKIKQSIENIMCAMFIQSKVKIQGQEISVLENTILPLYKFLL